MDVIFLSLDEVLRIHQNQLEQYGGRPGMRDRGLLESALAMPGMAIGDAYVHADLPAMAAAYLFHLVLNHPFTDGNKRVGAVAAFVFLAMNECDFTAPEEEFEEVVWAIAQKRMDKEGAVNFFRRYTSDDIMREGAPLS